MVLTRMLFRKYGVFFGVLLSCLNFCSLCHAEVIYEDTMMQGWTATQSKNTDGVCKLSPILEQNWVFDAKLNGGKFYFMGIAREVNNLEFPENFAFKFSILNKDLTKGSMSITLVDTNNVSFRAKVSLSSLTLDWQDVVVKADKFRSTKKGVKLKNISRILFGLGGNKPLAGTLQFGKIQIYPLEVFKGHNGVVAPSKLFAPNMVLQADKSIPVWGKAPEGVEVTITLGTQTKKATSKNGRWQCSFAPMTYGEPIQLVIQADGHNDIVFSNILIGEVWLCSGQSNMSWPVERVDNAREVIKSSNYPTIRMFTVERNSSPKPLVELEQDGRPWDICSPQTVASFSGVGYFFGKFLQENLDVPIGLIHSSWGGTPAEFWIGPNGLKTSEKISHYLTDTIDMKKPERRPMGMYNAMIKPVAPFAIRGAIWYQGESNVGDTEEYQTLFPAMITDWRELWAEDFPFYFVQLASYKPGLKAWPYLREAQAMTLSLKNTGMATAIDIGGHDIHPTNKLDVGKRLALIAQNNVYGQNVVYSGPMLKSSSIKGNSIVVEFSYVGSGLKMKGTHLTGFELAGVDGIYKPAKAVIHGDSIIVTSDEVISPINVRMGWNSVPQINLYNNEQLPATPFRTDSL